MLWLYLGFLAGGLIFSLFWLGVGYLTVFNFILRKLSEPKYLEWLMIFKKITWRDWFETNLRAKNGKSLERPFGSKPQYFDLSRILFNPVYLSRQPLEKNSQIKTDIVLGPAAKKPLKLANPIVLGGMSYGNALSLPAKTALAQGATLAETAYNSGNGPFIPEVWAKAESYILQLPRSFWSRRKEILEQVGMIELGLGHGAWGSSPIKIRGYKINQEFAAFIGAIPGLDLTIDARLPEVDNPAGLKNFVSELKEITGGVPIGVKFGCSHYLEQELEIMLEAGVDVITFDGAEGGSHGAPPILEDDMGLPTFPGLCRAVKFLNAQGVKDRISLVVGGGLASPGDFLKCLALGADAVIIGTIASITMVHTQATKSLPWEPPTGLIFHMGKEAAKFNPDLGAKHLSNFLKGCLAEMQEVARTLGKTSLKRSTRMIW